MKVFVTGVGGQLGHDVMNELFKRGYEGIGSDLAPAYSGILDGSAVTHMPYVCLDITDAAAVSRVISEIQPDAVIHCAGWTAVDAAEDEDKRALVHRINVDGTQYVADACKAENCKMLYLSTDYVFNGQGETPWTPDCKEYTALNVYGQTKLDGELAVCHTLDKFFIVRIAWVFGLNGRNFVKTMLDLSEKYDTLKVVCDQVGTPTYTIDLSRLLVDMVETEKYGYYHATNEGGYISWYEFACEIFRQAGKSTKVIPVTTTEYGLNKAVRPFNSRLDKSKLVENGFTPLPVWQDALHRYLQEIAKQSLQQEQSSQKMENSLMYQIDYRYLRPKKAEWLKRMYNTPFAEKQSLSVWTGQNATILPLREIRGEGLLFGRGGVVDEQGQYVALSGIPTRIGNRYDFENPVYRDEKVVYCGYLVNHWGHFLVEAVTRLWYVLENHPPVDKYVFFLDENQEREIKGNYREFFRLLKIWDKLEIINTPTTYREVIVPEIAFRCMEFYSPKYLEIFDTIADAITVDTSWKPAEKIFFTRSSFAKGNHYEFGTDCLDDFFRRNGFLVLAPEALSLSEMIFYIRSASEIATISGSAHHNMLFARNGQKLTIAERFVINVDYQVSINQLRKLDVTPIDANFHLYTIDTTGPLILGCNHILERYIADHAMVPPAEVYRSKKYRDKCFKSYMASYQDNYRYRWHMEPWYPVIADSLYEAYEDNYPYFKEYLDGNRPFLREHYFQIHYWKQFIKRLIRYHR